MKRRTSQYSKHPGAVVVYLNYDDRVERHFPHDIDPQVPRFLELAGQVMTARSTPKIHTENYCEFLAKGAKCEPQRHHAEI